MIVGVSYHAGECECYAFSQMIVGVSYHVGECKCWEFLTGLWDVFPHGQMGVLGLSDGVVGCVPPMVRCECWAWNSDMGSGQDLSWLDISSGWSFLTCVQIQVLKKIKTYMEARPTTSMKMGWLCRTFHDE